MTAIRSAGDSGNSVSGQRCTRPVFAWSDLFWAWLPATLLSGIPSTLYAASTGGDLLEATRAAGAMLVDSDAPLPKLIAAAVAVHGVVSLFWAAILVFALPRTYVALWAIAASIAIAVVDLKVIAPVFFPDVAALAFWPQLADHIMWGASLGLALNFRWRRAGAM